MFGNNSSKDFTLGSEDLKNEIIKLESFTVGTGSENVLRGLFQATPVPAFIFKKIGRKIILTDYSIAATNIINSIPSDPYKKSVLDIFADLPEVISDISTCFSAKSSFNKEILYKQNNTKPYRCFKFIYTFVEPNLVLVHVEEISEHSLIISALREQQERLELAIFATESGVWDWNVATGQVLFNEKWATMLGYSPNEIEGHIDSWENLLHPAEKLRVIECLRGHLKGESLGYKDEHRLLSKNGDWIWVLDTGKVVAWDNHGRPLRAVGTKIDITARKQMKTEIELRNLELKEQIEEKRRHLIEKELLLRKSEQKLKDQSRRIEKANNALKVLMEITDDNKKEIEANIVANIKELVVPYLEKIDRPSSGEGQKRYIDIIKSNLNEIVSPLSRKLTSTHLNLSSAEIKVADLIKHGKSTKEIADMLCLADKTVETHRRNIRKKLGINRKKINLRTYLRSIE